MVYAKCVLKKKVDWTTLKEFAIGDHLEEASIENEDTTIDVKKTLALVKLRKLAICDKEVVWSSNSSLDEHTHEYNGYCFQSDDEDVVMGEQRKALEVEVFGKGKEKFDDAKTLSNLKEQGM